MLWTTGGVVNHPICNGIHREKHKLDCFILWIPHDHRMASCWKDVIICLIFFWNLDLYPIRNSNPESAGFGYLYCSHWRNWSNGRSQPTKKHSTRPSSQPVFPEPADPTHFWGGCSTMLHNSVVLVGDQGQLQSQLYVWGLSQDMWFMCQQKKTCGFKLPKKNSESAGLSSSSSAFSAKMAHKMGHTIQFRDIPLVVSKQKLPIAHQKKPRHSTPAGGLNFRGNILGTWGSSNVNHSLHIQQPKKNNTMQQYPILDALQIKW